MFNFYERDFFDDPKKFEKHSDPVKVQFEELEASFVVRFAPLIFACFAFIAEWMLRLKDFLVFHQILRAFYALKRV